MPGSKLLINEPPLQVLPSLAARVGLGQAIVLQQVHYWLGIPQVGRMHDGHKWVYNTYEDWREQFPFWATRTIRRIVADLEEKGLLITGEFNIARGDRTKWYRIDYEALDHLDKMSRPSGQDVQVIPENTSESTDTIVSVPAAAAQANDDAPSPDDGSALPSPDEALAEAKESINAEKSRVTWHLAKFFCRLFVGADDRETVREWVGIAGRFINQIAGNERADVKLAASTLAQKMRKAYDMHEADPFPDLIDVWKYVVVPWQGGAPPSREPVRIF